MSDPSVFGDSLPPTSSIHDSEENNLFSSHHHRKLISPKVLKISPLLIVGVTAISAIIFNTYLFGLKDRQAESTASFQVSIEKLAANEGENSADWHFGLTSTQDAYAGLVIRTGDEIPRVVSMNIKLQSGVRVLVTDQNGQLYKFSHKEGEAKTRICAFAASSSAQLHLLVNQLSSLLQNLPNSSCLDF